MVFERLADGVIKHYKKIIIVWAVVLVLAVPAMLSVSDVVIYQETEAAPMDIESQYAQEIINENFAVHNSTLMVVIQSDDVTSEVVRDFTLMLQNELRNASASGRIKYFDNSTSVYTIFQSSIAMIAGRMAPMIYELENATNSTSVMIYGGPSFYMNAWGNNPINFTVFNESWNQYSAPITNESQKQMLYGYHYEYWESWNATFESEPDLLAPERAQVSVDMAVPSYFGTLPLDNETKNFTFAVWESFNITTWNNQTMILNFAVNMAASSLAVETGVPLEQSLTEFILAIYALGPNPTTEEVATFSQSIVGRGTLKTYPFQLPTEFLTMFVNVPKNDTALVIVGFTKESSYKEPNGEAPIQENVKEVRAIVRDLKRSLGVTYKTYVTGEAAISTDMEGAAAEDIKRIDPVTVIIIIVLIGAFFRSVVSPAVPLGLIGAAVVVSQGLIYAVGKYVANIHYSVLTLMFVVLMAAGTDYCIFMMARYREERKGGASRVEGVRTSVTWAGESIATSGATVMIGFGSMYVINYPLLQTMSLCLVMGIGVALLVALTLLPSIILLVGNRIFWPSGGKKKGSVSSGKGNPSGKKKARRGYFERSARFSVKHAKAIVIAALLVSIPTTIGTLTLATSFDMIAGMPDVESTEGIDAMSEGFGAGNIMRTYIAIQLPGRVYDNGSFDYTLLDSVEYLCGRIEEMENIETITGPTRPLGEPIAYSNLTALPPLVAEMYMTMMVQSIGKDNRTVMISVTFEEEPFTDKSVDTVYSIREQIRYIKEKDQSPYAAPLKSATIYVGGATASIADISTILNERFKVMAAVVLIGVFIVLLIVLGSVLVPLRLILTIALSISWTIAATLLVFQFIIGLPVLWMMPLILFVVLMGLGLDYDIFLVTRIREEVAKGKTDEEAIVTAVERTGGIITACGIIMAGAFGSMMLSTLGLLREFGFALAFAIILDAMIVRIYLVPAIMVLLKRWNWWAPGRLQRVRREEKRRKAE